LISGHRSFVNIQSSNCPFRTEMALEALVKPAPFSLRAMILQQALFIG